MVDFTNPTAYWKLNESSGNAADSSGNGWTLTNTGSTPFAAGKLNNCGDFTDNTTYFTSSETASWNFGTDTFTIAFWYKSGAVADSGVIGTCAHWIHAGTWRIINFGGTLYAYIAGTEGAITTTGMEDSVWHRVVIVREGTGANQAKIYVDGSTT